MALNPSGHTPDIEKGKHETEPCEESQVPEDVDNFIPKVSRVYRTKQELDMIYGRELREFSDEELLSLMSLDEAVLIETTACAGGDILLTSVSDEALMCRFNRRDYDEIDGMEDTIYNDVPFRETHDGVEGAQAYVVLAGLISDKQKLDDHESAERVRLLRSSRICRILNGEVKIIEVD